MEREAASAAGTYETDPFSTDDLVWEDPELSAPDEIVPIIPEGVPAPDALDQARTVPLDDDMLR
jgi:hypothetical protein